MTIIAEIDKPNLRNQKGFTLLEIMGVLVIIGILASTTLYRMTSLTDSADQKVLSAGIRELNIREMLIWTRFKMSSTGWSSDQEIYNSVDKSLGEGLYWNPAVQETGGVLHSNSQSVDLIREPSTPGSPAQWLIRT